MQPYFVSVPFTSGSSLQQFIFPLSVCHIAVSVPFTSGSSLQRFIFIDKDAAGTVSVPFTSGSSLQLWLLRPDQTRHVRFSSLYIGILAATLEGGA